MRKSLADDDRATALDCLLYALSILCSDYDRGHACVNVSRRTFIFAGALGVAVLAAVRYWPRSPSKPSLELHSLDGDGVAVMTAIVPVMLAGALPSEVAARGQAIAETVENVDRAIGGLSPQQIGELGHLFALLSVPPVRWSLTRSTRAWQDATPAEVDAFLSRLRDSRIGLLRAAYDALHQLVFGAWYGNPRAWPATGYGGPPLIG